MGGSPDSDMNLLWPSSQSGKGVGGAIVCALNHCSIAKWNRVAKWVNILPDNIMKCVTSDEISVPVSFSFKAREWIVS